MAETRPAPADGRRDRWRTGRGGFDELRWRLHTARLGSFLRHARTLIDLADDAAEKLEDEFIFDGQYVVSLTDRALQQVEELLLDAQLLAGWDAELERLADALRRDARDLYATDVAPPRDGAGDAPDPEVWLLTRFLRWMQDPPADDRGAVLPLVYGAVDAVFAAAGRDPALTRHDGLPVLGLPGGGTSLTVADLGGGLTGGGDAPTARHLACGPLRLLVAGRDPAAAREAAGGDPRRWLAVVDRVHLSLRGRWADHRIFLEATVTGQHRQDWLLLYLEGKGGEPLQLPPGSRSASTPAGAVIWSSGPPGTVEGALTALGDALL